MLTEAGVTPVFLVPIPEGVPLAVSIRGPYQSEQVNDFTGILIQKFQCYVRGISLTEAENLARLCYLSLMDGYPQSDIDANELIPLQGPTSIGTDEAGRYEFVFNFEVVCRIKKD